ncbi:MAG: hypothetical protein J6S94_01265 [Bacteroidaceae bacterium]|nr:hypothetical protein [Bacteroidaceae bacterium]
MMQYTNDILQKVLTLFIGTGAVIGAMMMWIDPIGMMCGCEPLLQMLRDKMPWPELFFTNFIPSGFVLLFFIGGTQLGSTILLFKKHRCASYAILACGILLMLWIGLEWYIFGFNAMSNIFFVLGIIEVLSAMCIFVVK